MAEPVKAPEAKAPATVVAGAAAAAGDKSKAAQPKKKGPPKAPTHVHKIESPVFPVSDAKGYEVIGTWRYGRGVDIEPDGVFDILHRMDPLSMLDSQTIKLLVKSVTGTIAKAAPINELAKDTKDAHSQAAKPGAEAYKDPVIKFAPDASAETRHALAQLRTHLTDKNIIDLGLARNTAAKGEPSVFEIDFRNFMAKSGQEGISKLPINNAAYTLADLGTHIHGHVCECKMAEANLLLEAADDSDFIQIATSVPPDADSVTKWAQNQALSTVASWQQSQDVLRGAAPERANHHALADIKAGFRSPADFVSHDKGIADAKAVLSSDHRLVEDSIDNFGKDKGK